MEEHDNRFVVNRSPKIVRGSIKRQLIVFTMLIGNIQVFHIEFTKKQTTVSLLTRVFAVMGYFGNNKVILDLQICSTTKRKLVGAVLDSIRR